MTPPATPPEANPEHPKHASWISKKFHELFHLKVTANPNPIEQGGNLISITQEKK